MEKSFNDLLGIKAVIGMETKDVEREDYVGTIWESIRMANNGAKKGLYLVIQAKEGLEQLRARVKAENVNMREEEDRVEHERHKVDSIQSQLD